jgi:hypothetical protein
MPPPQGLLASNTAPPAVAVHASAFTCELANGNEDVESYNSERHTRQTESRDCMHTSPLSSLFVQYFAVIVRPAVLGSTSSSDARDWSDVKLSILSILQLSNDLREGPSPAAAATSPFPPRVPLRPRGSRHTYNCASSPLSSLCSVDATQHPHHTPHSYKRTDIQLLHLYPP